MNNFELIDNYLTNRLNEQDRKSFENQLTSDPNLKADVELQKEIIQGVKAARIAELKSMLNKVPVGTPTFYLSPLRIAAGFVGAAVLATGLFFYFDKNAGFDPSQISSSLNDSITQTEQNGAELVTDSIISEETETDATSIEKSIPTEVKKDDKRIIAKPKENKPVIEVIDPTAELKENEVTLEKTTAKSSSISVARIETDVISSGRKFKNHYQFSSGKLILYGSFDNGLYEIIEVNAKTSRSLFLYYKSAYFLLDEAKKEITPLKEISDPLLIQKLKDFRSN